MKDSILATPVPVSMTSRDIAELTGKQHFHVMRDCRAMIQRLEADPDLGWRWESETYADEQGKERQQYRLDKNTTLTLVSGYDPVIRLRIIQRWQALEESARLAPRALPGRSSPLALLDALASLRLSLGVGGAPGARRSGSWWRSLTGGPDLPGWTSAASMPCSRPTGCS